jgi:hypothetical protein
MFFRTIVGQSHQGCRSEVRHMTDNCNEIIVLLGVKRHDLSSKSSDHLSNGSECII